MIGPFGVEVISKSAKSQVASQLKLAGETAGQVANKASWRLVEAKGPRKVGSSDMKALQLRLAGAQARKNVR